MDAPALCERCRDASRTRGPGTRPLRTAEFGAPSGLGLRDVRAPRGANRARLSRRGLGPARQSRPLRSETRRRTLDLDVSPERAKRPCHVVCACRFPDSRATWSEVKARGCGREVSVVRAKKLVPQAGAGVLGPGPSPMYTTESEPRRAQALHVSPQLSVAYKPAAAFAHCRDVAAVNSTPSGLH